MDGKKGTSASKHAGANAWAATMPIPELAESKVPHRWRSLSGSETARKILLEVTVQNFRLFGLFVDLNCIELG
jgi:hypothetical protein